MWLDLARYGDSAGYIHDPPRTIWRFRDWLIEALNRNQPYDQMTVDLLAVIWFPIPRSNRLLPRAFIAIPRQIRRRFRGAEFHFAAVCDRVNTTMQVWMGSSFACAQCHHHKYDPFSQQDYYRISPCSITRPTSTAKHPLSTFRESEVKPGYIKVQNRIDVSRLPTW